MTKKEILKTTDWWGYFNSPVFRGVVTLYNPQTLNPIHVHSYMIKQKNGPSRKIMFNHKPTEAELATEVARVKKQYNIFP